MRLITGTTPYAPVGDAEVVRGGGRWRGLAWLAWRQHRWLFMITALVVLAEVVGMLVTSGAFRTYPPCSEDLACHLQLNRYTSVAETQIGLVAILPGFVAVFWGAPLIAQEYEQRTHLLAWTQDITPRRWLAGKLVLVGGLAVVLATMLGTAAQHLAHTVNAARPADASSDPVSMFKAVFFEASPLVIAAYTICGFALGTAVSAIWRRNVPAMGVTLAVFAGIRLLTRIVFRQQYLPPKIALGDLQSVPTLGPDALQVENLGIGDAAGHPATMPSQCENIVSDSLEPWEQCLRSHGITHSLNSYQPGDRIPTFQLIEAGIFLTLAAVFLGVCWYRMRRI